MHMQSHNQIQFMLWASAVQHELAFAMVACLVAALGRCCNNHLLLVLYVLQVTVSALRKLEDHLTTVADRPPTDYHSQELQGILYKALAPLITNPSPDTSRVSPNPFNQEPSSLNLAHSSHLNPRVQRLLVLPKPYDPRVLPEGRQVLPGFVEQSSGVAPVHLPVEKEGVRLQCSGEAVFAGDMAPGMTGGLLYLAGGWFSVTQDDFHGYAK